MIDTSQYGHARCFNDWFLNVRELVERKPENKPLQNLTIMMKQQILIINLQKNIQQLEGKINNQILDINCND